MIFRFPVEPNAEIQTAFLGGFLGGRLNQSPQTPFLSVGWSIRAGGLEPEAFADVLAAAPDVRFQG